MLTRREAASAQQKPGPIAIMTPMSPGIARSCAFPRMWSTDALDMLPTVARECRVASRASEGRFSDSSIAVITFGPPG